MTHSDQYEIIVDTCDQDKAKQQLESWLKSNENIKKNLKSDDILVDHVLTEVNGEKTCHRRYKIKKKKLYHFKKLKSLFEWEPIPNCPGRYILKTDDPFRSITEILGFEVETTEHRVDKARDLVLISVISDCGIISYKRTDGSYLHTLNTMDGFNRKLNDLGIKSS
jgi:hypothetical protein